VRTAKATTDCRAVALRICVREPGTALGAAPPACGQDRAHARSLAASFRSATQEAQRTVCPGCPPPRRALCFPTRRTPKLPHQAHSKVDLGQNTLLPRRVLTKIARLKVRGSATARRASRPGAATRPCGLLSPCADSIPIVPGLARTHPLSSRAGPGRAGTGRIGGGPDWRRAGPDWRRGGAGRIGGGRGRAGLAAGRKRVSEFLPRRGPAAEGGRGAGCGVGWGVGWGGFCAQVVNQSRSGPGRGRFGRLCMVPHPGWGRRPSGPRAGRYGGGRGAPAPRPGLTGSLVPFYVPFGKGFPWFSQGSSYRSARARAPTCRRSAPPDGRCGPLTPGTWS
jgi:hypothetical protein